MFRNVFKPMNWLITLLIVIIVSSLFASTVQNSLFSVKVDKISFETDNGEISGYLFLPRDVDADNPAPAVILTHGYLNNAEMQEVGAIELSRRGFVVLAIDMYDHGDSTWDTPGEFSFFVRPMYDAVQFMYEKDYVLKDSAGNGMIGVSGHSMGGFASTWAVVLDELDFATNGYRKIAAALPVGSDLLYVAFANVTSMFQTRSYGTIAAHYDQFFFDNSADPVGSVIYKDFVLDPVGLEILGRTAQGTAEAGEYYTVDGGQRVIYTPDETHPQNTWSLETGSNIIEFFEEAFTYQLDLYSLGELGDYDVDTGSTSQVWWLKEAFTLIGLLALFLMIFPLFKVLTGLPIYRLVVTEQEDTKEEANEEAKEVVKQSKEKTYLQVVVIIFATLLAAYYLRPFMDRSSEIKAIADAMYYLIAGVILVTIAVWVVTIVKDNNEEAIKVAHKVTLYAIVLSFIALFFRWLLSNTDIISRATYWSAPSINSIVYWAVASGLLIFLIVIGTAGIFNIGEKVENPFGLKASSIQIASAIAVAVTMTIALLFLVALVEWIFNTDFRFYTYAIKIFNSHQFVAAFRYMPLFFIYYMAAAMTVFVNTKRLNNWKGDILAAFLLAGPVVVFLVYQYSTLYNTGVAAYPGFSLNGILALGLIPTLSVAGIISRRLSVQTGNIWTAVFFNTLFFTFITLANTTVYVISVM